MSGQLSRTEGFICNRTGPVLASIIPVGSSDPIPIDSDLPRDRHAMSTFWHHRRGVESCSSVPQATSRQGPSFCVAAFEYGSEPLPQGEQGHGLDAYRHCYPGRETTG